MQDFSSVLNSLVERWRTEGIEILAPSPRERVISVLSETGRKYSLDVVSLYCQIGGMADSNMDNRCFSLWPLDQLPSENVTSPGKDLAFADFLIFSHLYRFRVESETRSSVWIDYVNHADLERAAESVEEFFETLLLDPGRLQMFDEPPRI